MRVKLKACGKACIALCLAVFLCLALCACDIHTTYEPLYVAVLKCGKADAIVLHTQSYAMLIDASQEEGEEILGYLKDEGITRIDTMIITHYDKDHIGGVPQVLQGVEVGRVIEPGYEKSNDVYLAYDAALTKAGIPREIPADVMEWAFGDATVTLYPPLRRDYDTDNDFSLITRVEHGQISMLFMGDAQGPRLEEFMDTQASACHVLKVPHHGRVDGESYRFLKATSARIALITNSNKNPADEELLFMLQSLGIDAYQTRYGRIVVASDGVDVTVAQ